MLKEAINIISKKNEALAVGSLSLVIPILPDVDNVGILIKSIDIHITTLVAVQLFQASISIYSVYPGIGGNYYQGIDLFSAGGIGVSSQTWEPGMSWSKYNNHTQFHFDPANPYVFSQETYLNYIQPLAFFIDVYTAIPPGPYPATDWFIETIYRYDLIEQNIVQ